MNTHECMTFKEANYTLKVATGKAYFCSMFCPILVGDMLCDGCDIVGLNELSCALCDKL